MRTNPEHFIGSSIYDLDPEFAGDYLHPTCPGAETYFKNAFQQGQQVVPGELQGKDGALLTKLYTTTIVQADKWIEGQDTIPDTTVIVINPMEGKKDAKFGPTNAIVDLGKHLYLCALDETGAFYLARPIRGRNLYDYNYQTQMRRMYNEFLSHVPENYQKPRWERNAICVPIDRRS